MNKKDVLVMMFVGYGMAITGSMVTILETQSVTAEKAFWYPFITGVWLVVIFAYLLMKLPWKKKVTN